MNQIKKLSILRPIRKPIKKIMIALYCARMQKKIASVSKKRPIRVMFYVMNIGMWKSDKLFELLIQDKRFEPFIVSYLLPEDPIKYNVDNESKIKEYFIQKGFPFQSGYDSETNTSLPVDSFNPDIVFFPQPYNGYGESIPKKALCAYIPYCLMMEDMPTLNNSYLQNICWKMFYPTEMHKEISARYSYNKARNVIVTGCLASDYLLDGHSASNKQWKQNKVEVKRVIWAPHHTILPSDALDYSNFLYIADGMLDLSEKFVGKVEFAFKPHPRLKNKLYELDGWGTKRTDNYFRKWNEGPNRSLVEGEYYDLFLTSDALIHDCSSFTGEYLYVNKPVMFISKLEEIKQFNQFAKSCFNVHYHGSTIKDIDCFIQNVIDGVDPLKEIRTQFINSVLLTDTKCSVSEKIYNELKALVAKDVQ